MMNSGVTPETAPVQPEASAMVVQRVRSTVRRAAQEKIEAAPLDQPPKPGAAVVWGLTAAMALAGLGFTAWQVTRSWPAAQFAATPEDGQRDALAQAFLADADATYYDVRMRAGMRLTPANLEGAAQNAAKLVERDPRNAFGWAVLAMAEARAAGGLTANSEKDLRTSYSLCPMCDQDLTRLRFQFVLETWTLVPEDLRRAAFNEAETLRWTGRDAEYLAGMKLWARDHGVPYERYDALVKSPVPSITRPKPTP
jgi:hypothetical protein